MRHGPSKTHAPGALRRGLLQATRVWLPLAIAIAGAVAIAVGHARASSPSAAAGVALVIVALTVWMINWLVRISVLSNRDREREERAREYFERHGRWPDE